MGLVILHIILDSTWWEKDYNPDICFVKKNHYNKALLPPRFVLNDFSHTEHRLSMYNVGIQIRFFDTLHKFISINWSEFSRQVGATLFLSPLYEGSRRTACGIIPNGSGEFVVELMLSLIFLFQEMFHRHLKIKKACEWNFEFSPYFLAM